MFDPNTFQLAVTSLNAVSEIARNLIRITDDDESKAEINKLLGEVVAANQHTLAAQTAQFALSERVHGLEVKLENIANFREVMRNYKLQGLGRGAFAYVYQSTTDATDPVHWLCTTCCDNHRRSILQFEGAGLGRISGFHRWTCYVCKAQILVPMDTSP